VLFGRLDIMSTTSNVSDLTIKVT